MLIKSRIKGAIIGTAIGDAFGMPVEGLSPDTIKKNYGKIRGFVKPKTGVQKIHKLDRGQWTDDTQLMIAIIESIINKGYLDYNDIAYRHVIEKKSKRGWGGSTISGISEIESGINWWNSGKENGAGNGTPMKIAPIGILLGLGFISKFEAHTIIINISRMTHGDQRPAIAGILQAEAIASAINGGPQALFISIAQSAQYAKTLESVFGESDKNLSTSLEIGLDIVKMENSISVLRSYLGARSYVIESFPFMFCSMLLKYKNPIENLIEIVNQGGDSDTTGAMAGALIGAAYGINIFPSRFKRKLESRKYLYMLSDKIIKMKSFKEVKDKISGTL